MADKTENIKTRLSFDGEAEYKAACKEINSTLKVLNSEMKLVTAEYRDNANSAEALKAKQSVLQRTYDEQAKKVKTDQLHQKIYDFLLYIYPLLSKYPKFEKFSLQTATRNAILEMLQEVIKWDKTATKSHLYAADTALQQSKELLRLANDLKYSAMNAQHYGTSSRKLKEIGVMLGELIEEVKAKK